MRFTTLRVTPAGVLFLAGHRDRLAAEGEGAVAAFDRFAAAAPPGVYRVTADGAALAVERRGPTTLRDGMPARFAVSPFAATPGGAFPKPPPGGPYDALRAAGRATLLTTADGAEILEDANAAIVAWDGGRLVAAPLERPRVRSVAEAALVRALGFARAPLPRADDAPIALLNAVVGACAPAVPGRRPFPKDALAQLRAAAEATAARSV